MKHLSLIASVLAFGFSTLLWSTPIELSVDARDAASRLLHVSLVIPVEGGRQTIYYPKWLPGEHGPTGPIDGVAGLTFSANGKTLSWERDPMDMFAFHVDVPGGVQAIKARFDFLLPHDRGKYSGGPSSTENLLDLSWNHCLLYAAFGKASEIKVAAILTLPAGWKFGTALPISREVEGTIHFTPVSLETMVDSPLIAGSHFRRIHLAKGVVPDHEIDIVADSDEALDMDSDYRKKLDKLVEEALHLFGSHHYTSYHFLLTLSEQVSHFGLEHHESSDNRTKERMLVDDDLRLLAAGLMPHEMVHSWNGKFRRPKGLATGNYDEPMDTSLLWVYEGLTSYLGTVLTARADLRSKEQTRDDLALIAASLDSQPGRAWRPLGDTTRAAQILYGAPREWSSYRRGVDFYPEGVLIWLEADTIIRQESGGEKSLDDFCRLFFGGAANGPEVRPYDRGELIASLNQVARLDWKGFFEERIDRVNGHAPLGGITRAGYTLVFKDKMSDLQEKREKTYKYTDLRYSLGMSLDEHGKIQDLLVGGPAAKAGLAPGMKIIAVNGRKYDKKRLRATISAAKSNRDPIKLLVQDDEFYKTVEIDYHGGERYPHLSRTKHQKDLLDKILKSRA